MNHLRDFVTFVRKQGVVGLAIGFILGSAVNKVVTSFVTDIVQPIIGLLFGSVEGLAAAKYGPVAYGSFLVTMIDFVVLAAVVYFIFKKIGLENLDAAKEEIKK